MGAIGYLRKDASEGEIIKAIDMVLNNKRYISSELRENFLNDLQSKNASPNPFDKLSPRKFEIVQPLYPW